MKQLTLFVALLGIVVAGCGSEAPTVTPAQEHAYRNAPKNPPAGMAEGMKKAQEEAKQKQAPGAKQGP